MKTELEAIDKTIAHINWLLGMNVQVRLNNPKQGHDYYEMALNDVLRFITAQRNDLINQQNIKNQ